MNLDQLVLIYCVYKNENGETIHKTGTGYFITSNLVLTANHVIPNSGFESIRVRIDGTDTWIDAENTPCWQSSKLDTALIRAKSNIPGISVLWQDTPFEENQNWESAGYPQAAMSVVHNVSSYESKGLKGTLYRSGGRGQIEVKKLDLSVDDPPTPPELWSGSSGAPVFVGKMLAGIIRNVPANFISRLEGVPVYELLKDAGFKAAIEENPYSIPQTRNWAVILTSEKSEETKLKIPAEAALKEIYGKDFNTFSVSITQVLDSPGHLLNFINFIANAPMMIIDATGFQPGIMMIMGIRAVVRRGVSIVVTTLPLREGDLSNLPFNIREIKLISLNFQSYQHRAMLTSKDILKQAINEGRLQYQKNPAYLDLPPYDAVRNPVIFDIPSIKEKTLVLCPFDEEYHKSFSFIRENISYSVQTSNIVRMLDITSPQLVSQSLYEHIRWSEFCIVDWTNWLPNVFYELGVRLASSDLPPMNIISVRESSAVKNISLENDQSVNQKLLLKKLFALFEYDMDDSGNTTQNARFDKAIKGHLDSIRGSDKSLYVQAPLSSIYYDNIYTIAEKYFDWRQENVIYRPHIFIKTRLEREFGSDREMEGKYNILYSHNNSFRDAIQQQICEYWICAWYYFLNRYEPKEFETDELKTKELISIGESALRALGKIEQYTRIRNEIIGIIDKYEIL